MYLDYYYFILVVPVLIISLLAQARVNSAYNRFSAVHNMRGLVLFLQLRRRRAAQDAA